MEEDGGCLASFIDRGSVESHRYFLARRTVLEMLRDRGYAVSAVEIEQSLSQFRSVHGQQPDLERIRISASLLSDPSQKINELLVNVTKHVLMQAHEILTEQDKQKLLNKYGLKENQLPRMLASDAIARYYGLEPGQVVKVTHDGEDTGFHATYRCVV